MIVCSTILAGEDARKRPSDVAVSGEAERLVFLLQYVGSDYSAAVRNGRVVDDAEYRENREFAGAIAERFTRLRSTLPPDKIAVLAAAVRNIQSTIDSRGEPQQVRQLAEGAIAVLVDAFELRSFPRERPDAERARPLYKENCEPCHGPTGGGDGPKARDLDPRPARFADPARLDGTAPYVFYNAITLGVANTAMASFADSLTDQQRWDLAFFLWSFLPANGAVHTVAPPAVLSLRELATRSSNDLVSDVKRQAAMRGETIDRSTAVAWVTRLRVKPPPLSDFQERLARLRQDLTAGAALFEGNDFEAAADRVTTSYLTEFEPLEPELDRRDGRLRQDFERNLIEFRSALRHRDKESARQIALRLQRTADRARELLAGEPAGRLGSAVVAPLVGLLVAVFAVVWWVRTRRSVHG